jgi:hypothetical protein
VDVVDVVEMETKDTWEPDGFGAALTLWRMSGTEEVVLPLG